MKVFLTDQNKNFKNHLKTLKHTSIIHYDKQKLTCKNDRQELSCKFSDFDFKKFFNYLIFPSNILTGYTQWTEENRTIKTGDTIVQQINIPPLRKLSQRIIVGVRIKQVIDRENCKGFAYETLEGHVEKGISLFQVEQVNNKVFFKIETYSAPAEPLLNFFHPISSWYQNYCTKKALKNVQQWSRFRGISFNPKY